MRHAMMTMMTTATHTMMKFESGTGISESNEQMHDDNNHKNIKSKNDDGNNTDDTDDTCNDNDTGTEWQRLHC